MSSRSRKANILLLLVQLEYNQAGNQFRCC
jgi:hypothetical protein